MTEVSGPPGIGLPTRARSGVSSTSRNALATSLRGEHPAVVMGATSRYPPSCGRCPTRRPADRPRRMRVPSPVTPACATRPTRDPASAADARGAGSATATPTARRSAIATVLARIRALAIPPAWTDVWICPWPNGHLQATGRDARGRKQYRYHARWRPARDGSTSSTACSPSREVLPRIRRRCDADLATRGLSREKVLAAVVRLLETDADPRRQRRVRPAQPVVRADDPARSARDGGRVARDPVPVPRQIGRPARGRASRPPTRGGRPTLPGPARPGALPVRRRRRRGPRRRFGRRQRLPPRSVRRRLHARRTSGPGPAPCSRTARSGRSNRPTASTARSGTSSRRSGRPPTSSATRPAVARGSYVHPAVLEAYLDGSIRGASRRGGGGAGHTPDGSDPPGGVGGSGAAPSAARGRRRAIPRRTSIWSGEGLGSDWAEGVSPVEQDGSGDQDGLRRQTRNRGARSRSPRRPPRHPSPTSCHASPRSGGRPRTSRCRG